jgi:hypothetical protein
MKQFFRVGTSFLHLHDLLDLFPKIYAYYYFKLSLSGLLP